jgi:hypothetical protein
MTIFVASLLCVLLSGSTYAVTPGHGIRGLQQEPTSFPGVLYKIPITLSLQYVDEAVGSALETGDDTIPLVRDFCLTVQELVSFKQNGETMKHVFLNDVI